MIHIAALFHSRQRQLHQTADSGLSRSRVSAECADKLRFFAQLTESSWFFFSFCRLFSNLTFYFAEFQAASIFNSHFTSENELARFYGLFVIFASIFAFIFQGVITGNLIQRFGISNTNLLYPGLVLTSFAGTAVSYTLMPGTALKFVQVGLQNALYQPVNSLFYNAPPPREKPE